MSEPGRSVYGLHPVAEVLRTRPDEVECLYFLRGRLSPRLQALVDQAREQGVSVRFDDRERLRLLAGTTDHQSVVARVASFRYADLEDLLTGRPQAVPPILLALDGVQDPRNLGAALRSAEVFGVTGVIIPRDRAAGVTPVAVKVAAGAAERVPVARVTNLSRSLQRIKKAGIWIYGAEASAPTAASATDLTGPICLVVGGEEKGLRPLVRKQCDALVSLPVAGEIGSLNASIAAAVLCYEANRQRLEAAPTPQ